MAIDSQAIVLFPFAVRGPANLDYLSEGMIDLFQNAIDGVGGYRVISPVATRLRARQSGNPTDGAAVAAIARSLGARYVISGSITATGDELHVRAELYDAVLRRRVIPVSARSTMVALGRVADSAVSVMLSSGADTSRAGRAKWGTLLAAGRVAPNQGLLVADLRSAPEDSTFARIAADALRIAMQQSGLVRVASLQQTNDALVRMKREPNARVSLEIAREIARREGVAVIIDGDLLRISGGYILSARLVSAVDGVVMVAATETAEGPAELTRAVDAICRRMRIKLGESLDKVHATPALARVTTSSLEALQKYTESMRHEPEEAIPLLKQAVAIDSEFAMAWRRLASVYSNGRLAPPDIMDDAMRRALRFSDRLPRDERLRLEGSYYAWRDRARAIAAYEELGDQYPDAMNGLAVLLMSRREYARSEQIYRSLWHHGDSPPTGLINSLMNQGKTREADSLLEAGKWVQLRRTRAEVRCAIASVAECERAIDTVLAQGAPQQIVEALRVRSSLALQAGQIERSNRVWAEANAVDKARGGFWPFDIWRASGIDWHVRHRPDLVGARLDSLGEQNAPFMVAKMAVDYTGAGRTDKARSLLARFEREQLDTTASLVRTMIAEARVHIAIAERRWVDAIAGVKALDIIRDGPNPQYCSSCLALDLGIVYDSAGVADSAIVMYERYLATPQFPRLGDPDAFTRGPVYERLGILYERIGRPTEAEAYNQKFVNLWADADAELQPRVQAAKRRLELLRRARS